MWGKTKATDTNLNGAIVDLSGPIPPECKPFKVTVNGHKYTIWASNKQEAQGIAYNIDQFHK